MAKYPPQVERWRPLVAKYFPPNLVDKALWVIMYESNGDPNAVGDGGVARGLFQIQDNRAFANRPSAAYLDNPENNIRYAAEVLGAAKGNWAPWGEGVLYKGKKFGALGNHPYPGSQWGTLADGSPAPGPPATGTGLSSSIDPDVLKRIEDAGNAAIQQYQESLTNPAKSIASYLAKGILGSGGLGDLGSITVGAVADHYVRSQQDPDLIARQARLDESRKIIEEYLLRGEQPPEELINYYNYLAFGEMPTFKSEEDRQSAINSTLNTLANVYGTAVSMGVLKSDAAAKKIAAQIEQAQFADVGPYRPGYGPGGPMSFAVPGFRSADFKGTPITLANPDTITEAADAGVQQIIDAILNNPDIYTGGGGGDEGYIPPSAGTGEGEYDFSGIEVPQIDFTDPGSWMNASTASTKKKSTKSAKSDFYDQSLDDIRDWATKSGANKVHGFSGLSQFFFGKGGAPSLSSGGSVLNSVLSFLGDTQGPWQTPVNAWNLGTDLLGANSFGDVGNAFGTFLGNTMFPGGKNTINKIGKLF